MSITLTPSVARAEGVPSRNVPGRLGGRVWNRCKALFGLPAQRRLARAALRIAAIRTWEHELGGLSDAALRDFAVRLRGRVRGGTSLDRLLPEAFGAACVAAWRALGLRPFDVQLAGGVIMHEGAIAELATGEGKTLTAVFPAFLNALPGKGVHVTTVNDYLAKRDAEWTMPIYEALGMSVGVLQGKMEDAARAAAYRADLTYGTASEFGFDFLRDRLKTRRGGNPKATLVAPWTAAFRDGLAETRVQRGHHFALVDEADNVFIDDARTPLVIGVATRPASEEEAGPYRWADSVARRLEPFRDFTFDEEKQKIELTAEGRRSVRCSSPPTGPKAPSMDKLYDRIERALHAHARFRRDQHYLVDDDKVAIIDESTGRRMPDRNWSDGLHQAVEAKEGVTISTGEDGHAAQVTYQSYFRLYEKLSGMTGTAAPNRRELRRVYKLRVVCVPTNRPVLREHWPDRVFPTEAAKFDAVVEEVVRLRALGRPMLIGTRSVERSEMLSSKLTKAGVEHQVLNARQDDQEARLVAEAGRAGTVTIATNMAGRGTDVKLGDRVAACGGLHVLATERHEAARIDRQLAGRAGRQGDPGSCQFFLSLEDEILEALGAGRQESLQEAGRRGGTRDWQRDLPHFNRAQRQRERHQYRQRVDLLLYERQRQEILTDLGADPFVD